MTKPVENWSEIKPPRQPFMKRLYTNMNTRSENPLQKPVQPILLLTVFQLKCQATL